MLKYFVGPFLVDGYPAGVCSLATNQPKTLKGKINDWFNSSGFNAALL